MFSSASTQRIIDGKRAKRAKLILEWESTHTVDSDSDKYLHANGPEIVNRIQNGEWTAENVLKAYIQRAILVHSRFNCITEVMFDAALAEAKGLDADFAVSGQLRGPLHGIPVSLKDLYRYKGVDTTVGFTSLANNPSDSDAALVTLIRAAGGIPFVKTNVPQTMLSFECSNPLFGRTLNPWSLLHTSGGSSGGEAALLASDGSVFGVGSDIGGSLRIPTSYSGIYAIKPGPGRVTAVGALELVPGFEGIKTCFGPMARSVADVQLACQVLYGKSVRGSASAAETLAEVPFRNVTVPEKLKVGYFLSDGVFKASPASRRAVLQSVEALRKIGYECVEFDPPNVMEAMRVFIALTSADGFKTLQSNLHSDPKESSLFLATLGPRLPSAIRWLAAWLARTVGGDAMFATALRASRNKTSGEVWKETANRDKYIEMWYKEVWEKFGFNVILAPVSAAPALPHGATKTLSPLSVATILFNVVDSPVGVVPVTRVDPGLDSLPNAEWQNGPGHGSVLVEKDLYGGKNPVYDATKMAGLPVGVQIVGKKWEDELVVGVMKVLDEALGERGFGPGAWSPDSPQSKSTGI